MKKLVIEAGAEPVEVDMTPDEVEALTAAFPPPMVPATITRRQLLLALTAAELITPEEALAAATTGAVPALIDAVFSELTPGDALAARITWATMSVAERGHPLIAALVDAELATAEEVDGLFIAGAAIP